MFPVDPMIAFVERINARFDKLDSSLQKFNALQRVSEIDTKYGKSDVLLKDVIGQLQELQGRSLLVLERFSFPLALWLRLWIALCVVLGPTKGHRVKLAGQFCM